MRVLSPFISKAPMLGIIVGFLTMAAPTLVQAQAQADRLIVGHGRSSIAIPVDLLRRNDPGVPAGYLQVHQPRHGVLIHNGGALHYLPRASFWTLGADTFTYETELCEAPEIRCGLSTALVVLQVGDRLGAVVEDGFESEALDPHLEEVDPAQRLQISPSAGLVGAAGLEVAGPLWQAGFVRVLGLETPPLRGDGSQQGSGAQATFHLPDPPPTGPGRLPYVEDNEIVLLSGGPEQQPVVELALRVESSQQTLELRSPLVPSGVRSGVEVTLSNRPHHFKVLWWPTLPGRPAGSSLWLDGQRVAHLPLQDHPDLIEPGIRMGVVESDDPMTAVLYLDEVLAGYLGGRTRDAIVLWDAFETTGVGPWSQQGAAWLSFDAGSAAATGNGGLEAALLGAGTGGFATAELPSSRALDLSLDIDLESLSLGPAGQVTLVEIADPQGTTAARLRVAALPAPRLFAEIRRDDGSWANVPVTLPSHAMGVDLRWVGARSARAQDGSLRLWIDGGLVAEISGVANAAQRAGELRVGAREYLGAPTGTVSLDNVVVRSAF